MNAVCNIEDKLHHVLYIDSETWNEKGHLFFIAARHGLWSVSCLFVVILKLYLIWVSLFELDFGGKGNSPPIDLCPVVPFSNE